MKKIFKLLFLCAPLVLSVASCGNKPKYTKVESDTLYAKKIENLSDDFIMGMDVSSVIAEEQSGVKYYDYDGKKADLFKVIHDNGINMVRVRVWNNPYDAQGHGYGGGNNDLAKAIEIGKRANKYGMKLLVDFHYSDFWADPAKQMAPKGWENFTHFERYYAIQDFTLESLQKMKDAGVNVGMVQIGNETSGGRMAGYNGERSDYFVAYINAAAESIKKVYPNALKAVHFTNPENAKNYLDWAGKLDKDHADYDVFGTSYYPYWHGTLENLQSVLSQIAEKYNKKVMVLETSYCFDSENTDFWSNTIGDSSDVYKPFPFTVAGQANHVSSVIETIANTTNGIGVCYWEGAWIPVGTTSFEENSRKWEQFGSGWASSYAGEYDKEDAGQWYGGSAVENQAFFDKDGHPLESLKIWNLVRFGNDAPRYIDGIRDAEVTFNTSDDIVLPATVSVVYNDTSTSEIPVTWQWAAEQSQQAKAAGNGKYVINGTAEGGTPVKCFLTVLELNFVQNYSFEEEDVSMWKVTNNASVDFNPEYLKAEVTGENVQTGKYAFAFWGKNANTVNFDVEQDLDIKNAGIYKFQASFTGGAGTGTADPAKLNIYIFVKVDGVIKYQQAGLISAWNSWHDAKIPELEIKEGEKVTIGAHIEAEEADIWGSVDDFMFNFVR